MLLQSGLFLLCTLFWTTETHTIKHVIVLMEENRSFDHIFGYYPGVNGLSGSEWNPFNTSDPGAGGIRVNDDAPYVALCGPDHGTNATTYKIFGADAMKRGDFSKANMNGFVELERSHGHKTGCDVMSMFPPQKLPVISALAKEFVLFDRFFCSHAGPTWPNRMFMLSGTSAGSTDTGCWYHDQVGKLFPQKTFFDQVKESGLVWKNYYNDTPWELFMAGIANNPEHLASMAQFYKDAREGTLPSYAFINPRSGINVTTGVGSNDMHPDHDMAAGEQYYKDIYEALRASPQWNDTLFIITFDEHGGFYDHVPTPLNVPPPGDGEKSYPLHGIDFNRLGVRIPTLLISPWVPKGLVVSHPPAAQKPAPNSEYELTSIMATAYDLKHFREAYLCSRKLLGINLSPLTKRDAWAATFENVLETVNTPRTDCPMHLPASPPVAKLPEVEAAQEPNDLQMHIMTVLSHLTHTPFPDHITKQAHVSEWVGAHFENHKVRTATWKRSKNVDAVTYQVVTQPLASDNWIDRSWTVNHQPGVPAMTVSTRRLVSQVEHTTTDKQTHKRITETASIPYCLDAEPKAGAVVGISVCYPSQSPLHNRDPHQHWIWSNDATFRPYANQTLCLTNHRHEEELGVTLEVCEDLVNQHWAYHGAAPGDTGNWAIYFGDATNGLGVIVAKPQN